MKYLQDTSQISPGHQSNILRHLSNISRKIMEYLKVTYEKFQGNLLKNSRKPIIYLKETYEITRGNQ